MLPLVSRMIFSCPRKGCRRKSADILIITVLGMYPCDVIGMIFQPVIGKKVFCQTNATLHFLKKCRIMQVWLKTTMEGMMEHMKLHGQIFVLRKSMGVTQEELARVLGVTNQAVSKWESAQCSPDIQLLPDIADYFGVSVDELMGHETPVSKNRVGNIAGEHLEAAMALLKEGGEISTTVLQRRLNIGYAAAKELIRALEEQGRIEAAGKWKYRMVAP